MNDDKKVRKASEDALCDLNSAYAIIAICEGGVFRSKSGRAFAQRIVKQCKAQSAIQLRAYDRSYGR